jgi:hypothetical protein
MLNRREMVIGGLLTAICGCGRAHGGGRTPGCMVDDEAVQGMLGDAPRNFGFSIEKDPLANGSGDRELDRALAVNLARLCDMFGVLPGFAFYDDSDAPNAFASTSKRLGRADGTVVFGKTLLRQSLQKEHGDAVMIGICAHEFGHVAGNKRGANSKLIVNGKVKRFELHADYLAGYFAGRRKLEKSDFPSAVIALGQFSVGDTEFSAPDHHGTPEERGQAVVEGFQAAYRDRKTFDRAFNDGVSYVSRIPI